MSKAAQSCQIGIIRFWKQYITRSTAPAHIPSETEGCYFSVAGKDSATGPGCRASSWLLGPHSSADPIVLEVSVVEKDDMWILCKLQQENHNVDPQGSELY